MSEENYQPTGDSGKEQMTISVRVTLPDITQWRAYKFARQYPYLALAASIIALMALVLLANGVSWIWHIINKSSGVGNG